MIDSRLASWTDVRDHVAAGNTVAFLPFGAHEEHGPHLPLSTDTIVAVETAKRLSEHYNGLLLPEIAYGETWVTSGYPGTISLSPTTVTAIAVDIGMAVAGFGIRQFVIVNGDFGNRVPLAAAGRALNEKGIATIVLDYPGMDAAIAAARDTAPAHPIMNHAEEIETSMVLAAAPTAVSSDRYVAEYPEFPVDFGLRPIQLHEVSASGVFGDPTTASAAKGEALYDAVVTGSIVDIDLFIAGSTR
jgi:creatinine amidohydrolase